MTNFFAANYHGPAFELFGTAHFAALGALMLLNLFLLRFKKSNDSTKSAIRWMLTLILLINEIAWHYWNYVFGQWTIQTMLPLHLCSLLVWTGAFMLITKNYGIYGDCRRNSSSGNAWYWHLWFPTLCVLPIFSLAWTDHHICHLHDGG